MPADLIAVSRNGGLRPSAPIYLLECPPDLRVRGRLDADGALLIIVETRDTDATGQPLSTVSVSWNRYRGEAISCATGEIDAPPSHIEFARRAHATLVLALCASAAKSIGSGPLELVTSDGGGHV